MSKHDNWSCCFLTADWVQLAQVNAACLVDSDKFCAVGMEVVAARRWHWSLLLLADDVWMWSRLEPALRLMFDSWTANAVKLTTAWQNWPGCCYY